ncbi:S-ribosylhomocysteine lyase [Petrocella atlantisensis]|uniref:S-ribosylhomocysteine lyase n=1 Tax=Petrocella atlantisensis TaxID=2173034 RepID=A0A3P7PC78_9FIRM|nr:S-ribosylhomocysteine lyase [Petrocella atlantisensis]MCF8018052.1 S-ribosylhomocysteine lyase [Vallitaleaceae bacterium]VDN46508.1 S-ribosylhomocysteine lyase [Petrocella atlantisensis]
MDKIPSFNVNHLELLPGIYVSRKDHVGNHTLTTFDIRMTRPNFEPVLQTAEIHALEHMGATFLRQHVVYGDQTIYFGPMGCRTGFYLILKGDLSSDSIVGLIKELFEHMADYNAPLPGASARDCGNYLDMNLPMAKYEARRFLDRISNISSTQLNYPD